MQVSVCTYHLIFNKLTKLNISCKVEYFCSWKCWVYSKTEGMVNDGQNWNHVQVSFWLHVLHRLFFWKKNLGTIPNCAMEHMVCKPPLTDHCVCENLDDQIFQKIPNFSGWSMVVVFLLHRSSSCKHTPLLLCEYKAHQMEKERTMDLWCYQGPGYQKALGTEHYSNEEGFGRS